MNEPVSSCSALQERPSSLIATSGSIVVKNFTGRFKNLRFRLAAPLALSFFILPWLQWNGHQSVLWDLDGREFYVFGATFLPQDLLILTGILLTAAFGLLAVNLVVGRAWCGYLCPQSIWTWAFIWAENLVEGDRHQRLRLDRLPWTPNKLIKKISKHSLWIAMSFATGFAFVGYFVPARELAQQIIHGEWLTIGGFWIAVFAGVTYVNAGWLREQVCLHMCPYSRFQSVMFDRETLVITYDSARGETRGSRRKEADRDMLGLGDCIDCQQCVQVCPTGIDIREGLQMDCIGCGACIDACDSVMQKMDYSQGLIRYASEAEMMGEKPRRLRPVVWMYGVILLSALVFLLSLFVNRALVDIHLVKDRNLYRVDSQGNIVNVYLLKVTNKSQRYEDFQVNLDNAQGLQLQRYYRVSAAAGERVSIPIVIVGSRKLGQGVTFFNLRVMNAKNPSSFVSVKANFVSP